MPLLLLCCVLRIVQSRHAPPAPPLQAGVSGMAAVQRSQQLLRSVRWQLAVPFVGLLAARRLLEAAKTTLINAMPPRWSRLHACWTLFLAFPFIACGTLRLAGCLNTCVACGPFPHAQGRPTHSCFCVCGATTLFSLLVVFLLPCECTLAEPAGSTKSWWRSPSWCWWGAPCCRCC